MILIDIYVPSVERTYDFMIDEKVLISSVIEEISEMISQKEKCNVEGEISKLMLCDSENECILPGQKTLYQCGIVTGKQLVLV